MSNSLLFDFTVDKASKSVTVVREFDADLDLVWDAFTTVELLDQWWAPKPWASRTKEMNFEEGGKRFYAMVGPGGEEHWSVQLYRSISPKTNFTYLNAFASADGTPDLPGSDWDLTFTEEGGKTKVTIYIYNESLERMEQMIAMGFKEGFTACLQQLNQLVSSIK